MKTNRTVPPCLALAAAFAALAACDRKIEQREGPQVSRETQTTAAERPSVEHVKDDPARFYGKKITLSGEVDAVKGNGRVFTLEGNDWLFTDKIRVLTRAPVKMGGMMLADDDQVLVTGTVRRFVRAELDRELGWSVPNDMDKDLADKPVLVADEIRRIEPEAAWTAAKPEGELRSLSMLAAAQQPDALVGTSIVANRERVQSVSGKGVFLGPSHTSQTFVLAPAGADLGKLKAGDVVDVRGTVKKTPAAAEAVKNWNLPATLRDTIEREPLYVEAASLAPSAHGGAPTTATPNAVNPATGAPMPHTHP